MEFLLYKKKIKPLSSAQGNGSFSDKSAPRSWLIWRIRRPKPGKTKAEQNTRREENLCWPVISCLTGWESVPTPCSCSPAVTFVGSAFPALPSLSPTGNGPVIRSRGSREGKSALIRTLHRRSAKEPNYYCQTIIVSLYEEFHGGGFFFFPSIDAVSS